MAADRFANIAFEENKKRKDSLKKIHPITHKKNFFKPTDKKSILSNKEEYDEKLKKFKEDLSSLKDKYSTYMQNYLPEYKFKRETCEFKKFQFRYENKKDKNNFERITNGLGKWESVIIPDYRGPVGKWTGFYRTEFISPEINSPEKCYFLVFKSVDYISNIYLNGRFVGNHEGFFAPFEIDVTDYLLENQKNVLVVEIKNDAPTLGLSSWDDDNNIDGNKIYAATGPGWDSSDLGWHHCPPGAGIIDKVFLEERSHLFVQSTFIRPNIDEDSIEIWTDIYNTKQKNKDFDIKISIFPRNFIGKTIEDIDYDVEFAGPGINNYRLKASFNDYRLWSPNSPWLYTARVSVFENKQLLDQYDCNFGMRKFHMDKQQNLKGTLYLNNEPVFLRGANDMGHMQQCVMNDNYDQLIEDILIAKLANMNFYRFTQRPVQSKIYEYCDMLGMMNQTDLPLFGYIRRNLFSEGIKQAREMERLIRSHPSAIMTTFINEPFSAKDKKVGHRHLYRNEMEDFFVASSKAIKLESPDRVIKNVEGDYDPPTKDGLSDFHCYNMWYTNHALPVGEMIKGYLPPIKKGWKTGCGEYSGGEGLDPEEIMFEDYPKSWLPKNKSDDWTPEKIIKSQTMSMHGDWYEEQNNLKDWITQSQRHQALGTRVMTDSLRRRSDYVVSTAIHLLIDAWPSGWMKSLVDYKRTPKPAYFEFQKSLEPLRINLRSDRFTFYGGEEVEIEAWILNDTSLSKSSKIIATLQTEDELYQSLELDTYIESSKSEYKGTMSFKLPLVTERSNFFINAKLVDEEENLLNSENMKIEVFNRILPKTNSVITCVDDDLEPILNKLNVNYVRFEENKNRPSCLIFSSPVSYNKHKKCIDTWINNGTKCIFLLKEEFDSKLKIGDINIETSEMNGIVFAARNKENLVTADFKPRDFSFLYNRESDMIDFIAKKYIKSDKLEPLIFTYKKPAFGDFIKKTTKYKNIIVGKYQMGNGEIIVSTIPVNKFIGFNPVIDKLLINILL